MLKQHYDCARYDDLNAFNSRIYYQNTLMANTMRSMAIFPVVIGLKTTVWSLLTVSFQEGIIRLRSFPLAVTAFLATKREAK